jgi:phosphate transport system permease protein
VRSGSDTGFRAITGAFGILLLAVVLSIGLVLFRESILSIREFGLRFWITDVWDPVAAQFGARPFI